MMLQGKRIKEPQFLESGRGKVRIYIGEKEKSKVLLLFGKENARLRMLVGGRSSGELVVSITSIKGRFLEERSRTNDSIGWQGECS